MGGLVAALQAAEEPDTVAGLILIDPALPTARLGLVHPRVVANFLLCAVPGVGESYLTGRRRRTTAEQTVRRVLGVCCVDASRVPDAVVEAHVELTEQVDRAQADAAYLRSARSLSSLLARPAGTLSKLQRVGQPTLLLHGAGDVLVPIVVGPTHALGPSGLATRDRPRHRPRAHVGGTGLDGRHHRRVARRRGGRCRRPGVDGDGTRAVAPASARGLS